MSLREILSSTNMETRCRGGTLVFSLLTTSPLRILNSFEEYDDLIKNIGGSILGMINALIVEQAISNISSLSQTSIPYIINYLCYFIENPHICEKVSLKQEYNRNISRFHELIELIFKGKASSYNFSERIRALSISLKESLIIKITDQNVYKQVIEHPKPAVDYLIKCIFLDKQNISDYAAKIFSELIMRKIEMASYLYEFKAFIATRVKNVPFNELHNVLTVSLKDYVPPCKLSLPLENALHAVIVKGKSFQIVDPSEMSKWTQATVSQKNNADVKNIFLHPEDLVLPKIDSGRKNVTQKQDNSDKPLGQFLQKPGNFGQWQQRWFEFYPASSTLLWKSKADSPKLKGVIIFDNTYEINQETDKNKFVQSLTPKSGKRYQLAFPNQEDLNKWKELIVKSIRDHSN